MKNIISLVVIATIVAIGFAFLSPSSGYTAQKNSEIRVWVEFQPGRKGVTEAVLQGSGAQFHYTFDELNSFVVTLPISAI